MHCTGLVTEVRTACLECIFHHLKPLTRVKHWSLSKTYVSGQAEIAWIFTGISGYNSMALFREKIHAAKAQFPFMTR